MSYVGWYQPINRRFVLEILVVFVVVLYAQIVVLDVYAAVNAVFSEVMPSIMMMQPLNEEQTQLMLDVSQLLYDEMGLVTYYFGVNLLLVVSELQKMIFTSAMNRVFYTSPLFWVNVLCVVSYGVYLWKFTTLHEVDNMGFGV